MPAAQAEPSEPPAPSQAQVDAARQDVESTARSVEAIQADLASADQELEGLGVAAARAAEAYNGAVWRLQQARSTAEAAQRQARRSTARMGRQRQSIGALVAATYQGGGDLSQVSAYLASHDPDALLDRFAALNGASASMQARLDRFRAVHSLNEVFRREAQRAVAEADAAEQDAAVARQDAQQAVAAQESAVARIATRKDALVRELAQAQSISVELAAQRQEALERREELRRQRAAARAAELARQRAAEETAERVREARAAREAAQAAQERAAAQARAEAEAAQERAAAEARAEAMAARDRARQAQQARDAAAAREARAEARAAAQQAREAREARRAARREARQERREERAERREERRERRQQARASAYSGGGASQAVAFALDQVGEPYVWGGAGPDVWDCSGLTAGAWGSAGRYLSHYSAAQYYETTRVGYSDLRPGDLIFWSGDGTPEGIFHVAMYIGDDQMVHAANPSDPVKVDSVWYWEAPDFFGRV